VPLADRVSMSTSSVLSRSSRMSCGKLIGALSPRPRARSTGGTREPELNGLGIGVEAFGLLLFDTDADLVRRLKAIEHGARDVAGHALHERARAAGHLFANGRGDRRDVDRGIEVVLLDGVVEVGPHPHV